MSLIVKSPTTLSTFKKHTNKSNPKTMLPIILLLITVTSTTANTITNHHTHNNHHDNDNPAPIIISNEHTPDKLQESSSSTVPLSPTKQRRCQEISIPMCKSIRYNYTEMPNSFNHETQEEAGLEVHQYWPLVEIKCSSDLKFFICSLYVPICMEDYTGTVPPCRSVCERARAGCEPVMTQYGFFWPERMACDQFPKFGKHSICMDEKNGELPGPTQQQPKPIPKSAVITTTKKQRNCTSCTCNYPLIQIPPNQYVPIRGLTNNTITITTGSIPNCLLPCHGYGYSSPEELKFASYWLTTWSTVTAFLSTLTVLTFLIDSTRFNYPERPIIMISFCYVFVSFGYLVRIHYGHSAVACGGDNSPVVLYPSLLVSPHQSNSQVCTVVFLLTYYFTIAGSCWYVVLTVTWYLASVLKWSTEAISVKSNMFHGVVWVTSALLTLTALLSDAVDGDSISGICFVGNQSTLNLGLFVLVPMAGLLLLGTVFLISGFVSLVRIRRVIAREVRNFHKLEKLMIRIGVFGVLYSVNVGCVLGGFVYEAWVRGEWVEGVNCGGGSGDGCGGGGGEDGGLMKRLGIGKPAYSVLMIKYFMSLATGLTASIWVFSTKTIETWKTFVYSKLLCCCCFLMTTGTTENPPDIPNDNRTGTINTNKLSYKTKINTTQQPQYFNSSSFIHHHHHVVNNSVSSSNNSSGCGGGGSSSCVAINNKQTHV